MKKVKEKNLVRERSSKNIITKKQEEIFANKEEMIELKVELQSEKYKWRDLEEEEDRRQKEN